MTLNIFRDVRPLSSIVTYVVTDRALIADIKGKFELSAKQSGLKSDRPIYIHFTTVTVRPVILYPFHPV